jgi:hypothetical protein
MARPIHVITETRKEHDQRVKEEFRTLWVPLIKIMFFYAIPSMLLLQGIIYIFNGQTIDGLQLRIMLIGGAWLGLVIFIKFIWKRKKTSYNEHRVGPYYKRWYVWVILILVAIIIVPKIDEIFRTDTVKLQPSQTASSTPPINTPAILNTENPIIAGQTGTTPTTTTAKPTDETLAATKDQVKSEWKKPARPKESLAEKIDRIKQAAIASGNFLNQSQLDASWNTYGIECQTKCPMGFYGFHYLSRDWADCQCRDGSHTLVDISNATRLT